MFFLALPLFAQEREWDRDREPPELQQMRREWFLRHYGMPISARLKAIEEVRAMRERQQNARAAAGLDQDFSPTAAWAGNSWTNIGPQPIAEPTPNNNLGGRINAIAINPSNANNIFIGGADGGVWRTTDGGTTWTPLTDSLGTLSIASLAIDPSNPNNVYAGTGDEYGNLLVGSGVGVGILKSTNGGNSWTLIPGPFSNGTYAGQRVNSLAVHPSNGQILLAGATYSTFFAGTPGIYRSADGGATWQPVLTGPYALQVVFDPNNGSIAYATLAQGNGSKLGIYRSTDAGVTWNPANGSAANPLNLTPPVYDVRVAVSKSSPGTLYAATSGANLIALQRSTDSGGTWTTLSSAPDYCTPQCTYGNVLLVHPTNSNIVYAGGVNMVRSTDGGATWKDVTPGYVDQHAGVFSGDATKLFIGDDGGMWVSPNPTAATPITWNTLNNGLSLTQFYPGISIHPTNINIAYGGAQDTGLQRYTGTKSWSAFATFFGGGCGDAGWTAIDPTAPSTVYMACYGRVIWKATDGLNFHQMQTGVNQADRSEFEPPLAIDPVNPQRLYFGTYRIYQTTNGATSWAAISGDLTTGGNNAIGDIVVASTNNNYVYVATTDSKVWVTTNAGAGAGAVWNDRSAGLPPNQLLQGLAVDFHNEQVVYVATTAFSGPRLFRSTAAGQGWTDITGSLPNLPIDSIALDPDMAGTIFVGTEQGVFYSTDNGASWQPMGTGLPLVVVTSMKVHHASRKLRIGTFGRGMWDISIPIQPPALSISKSHSANFGKGQQGATYSITVTNAATAGPTTSAVTVTDTLPAGLSLVSMAGPGWSCASNSCNRSDVLYPGTNYPAITVTVNVSASATSPQINQASVSGGGSASANTSDSTVIATATIVLSQTQLNYGLSASGSTDPQTVAISFTGGGVAWTATPSAGNIIVSPPSGAGNGTFQVSVTGPGNGTVTVAAAGATNSPQVIQIRTVQVTPGNPFGSFDTPANNTTGVAGAIAVTGWALDNIQVAGVTVWREPVTGETPGSNGLVFVGNAVFVVGARPDVQTQFPNVPFNYRAGWGYMLLTNFLPGGGNGVYKLHALVVNKTGGQVDLGTHSITVDNAHASKPFGTIDTPDQGGTASGNAFINFGWSLTPTGYCIPVNGSTMTVYIDGVPLGHPTYNQPRADIMSLFPGYCNTAGAVGYFFINTTTLTNGVHTIQWVVYDDHNRGDGIGSRYFTVQNNGASAGPIDPVVPDSMAAAAEVRHIQVEELGRIELDAGAVAGYTVVAGERRRLPIGSTLQDGVFYWQLGPGFLGRHELVLVRADGAEVRLHVQIGPKRYR